MDSYVGRFVRLLGLLPSTKESIFTELSGL